MTELYYFDTNPLVSWADARAVGATARDVKIGRAVAALVDGPEMTATSEIGLLEFHSRACDHWRNTAQPNHDDAWFAATISEFMRWLESGSLLVLPSPINLAEKAMTYLEGVTRRTGRKLRAWDAAHLYQAAEWARTSGTVVRIVTSDGDFLRLLPALPEFSAYVSLVDPAI